MGNASYLDYVGWQAALAEYKHVLEASANRERALDVALVKLRAYCPTATEWEFRSWLAKVFAAERARAS
jgi:hypothetical protein